METKPNQNRRTIIKTASVAATALSYPGLIGLPSAYARSDPFSRKFALPALNTGVRQGQQIRFELDIAHGESNFIGQLTTPTLGINQPYLGQTLRARRGDKVQFQVRNHLSEAVALHWHGMKLPAAADGGPHQAIPPGKVWTPEFKVDQPAASLWYHAHTHGRTGEQVYHGLAGMFIVEDETSEQLSLPYEYGVDDLPVVIQDRRFARDGRFQYLQSMHDSMMGMQGDTMLVNGVVTPTLRAQRSLLRLRLLNGCNARTLDLAFDDGREMAVIASDGSFLPTPVMQTGVRLAPGERAEVIVNVKDGREATLQAHSRSGETGMIGMMERMMGGNTAERLSVMRIVPPQGTKDRPPGLPKTLITPPDWGDVPVATKRKIQLEMQMGPGMMMSRIAGRSPFSINGKTFDMRRIDFRAKANSVELWEVENSSNLPHPFHIHNTQFKILARSQSPLPELERGLKDTVLVYPGERVRLLVPFPAFSNARNPYMYHCHILEHEDGGMMGQFTVEA